MSRLLKGVAFVLGVMLSWQAFASEKEVIIAGDNWCPINCGKDDPQQGYMIDVARLALKQSGYTLKYVEMPWARALVMARKGDIHGVVGAFRGDAPDFIFPNSPLLSMSSSNIFSRVESDWQYDGLKSLEPVRLGVIRDYDYGAAINGYVDRFSGNPNRVSIMAGDNAVERIIKQLLRGRVDAFVETAPVFWYTAKNLKVTQLVKEVGAASEPEFCYVAFSPNHPESQVISKAFDFGVLPMAEQGKLSLLGKAYGLPESVIPDLPVVKLNTNVQ
jgi:polar amino acid transport system substrate-binding protein